ncbi:MAG: Asp-tRNA(Asn)/Glu-tRNA(Gln) amidotransferase subunit GatA [Coriobacteriia bacterium]|nr:Asp-tRNA(Asn)/Glu-tRNA(Gln) amidotransferase subunit GatA [Coriobacteriia bacterium]
MNYPQLSVAAIRDGLLARQFSAQELAKVALDTVKSIDPAIHAYLELCPELAHLAAEKLDAALVAGTELPGLAGVPIAYKDNMNLQGTHTTCASKMLENYQSPYTATCVAKTLEAGALPLGKLNMDEFAFGSSSETSYFGPTLNPWDLKRVPGGSSSGSAAAVAAGLATVTLGSDTGGSIRQPAAFCGVVGFKPSYGVVSRYGVVAFGSSLDQVGALGRSVNDVAATIDAISGLDPLDGTSQALKAVYSQTTQLGVKGMRIGVVTAFMEAVDVEADISTAFTGALAHLEALGAEIVEITLPNAKAALSAYYVIGPSEAFSNMSRFDGIRYGYQNEGASCLDELYEQGRANGFGKETRRRIMLGSYLLSSGAYDTYYYPAQQVRTLITQDYHKAFEKVDALLTPTTARTAFEFGEVADPVSMYLSDIFTIPSNIAGNGGMHVPVGLGKESGLPVGVQITGPQLKDENIFRAAAALESCYPSIARLAPVGSTEGSAL